MGTGRKKEGDEERPYGSPTRWPKGAGVVPRSVEGVVAAVAICRKHGASVLSYAAERNAARSRGNRA